MKVWTSNHLDVMYISFAHTFSTKISQTFPVTRLLSTVKTTAVIFQQQLLFEFETVNQDFYDKY